MIRKQAFTLAESLVALGILAAMILCIGALFLRMLAVNDKTTNLTAGSSLAQLLLEEAVARGTYDVSTGNITTALYTQQPVTATEFIYRLTSTEVTLPGTSPKGYYVQAEVWWWDATQSQRQGVGQLYVRLDRMVTP